MRSQGCTIQQALTQEAAAVVKQAVGLAKRRGHAQVTPLHVAHTMLSSSSGLLRAACLQSHSHPLQCRALELCFNVALNRLPTSTSGPMLGPHSAQHYPTIANALVAAFKRAQAHQRRGSIENQQQPLLAVKIELEQLIISILDDPSVSRVMREAGFSSTLVKGKVEQAVSIEIGSQNQAPNTNSNNNNSMKPNKDNTISISPNMSNNSICNNVLSIAQPGFLKASKPSLNDQRSAVRNEDVVSVIEGLACRKKRNNVVVGECIATLEGIVKEVMDRVEKGQVPEGLKEVKFFQLSLASFGDFSREEVEQRVEELKCLVKNCCMDNNKGLILYLDDLKWANEFRVNNILVDQHQPRRSYYCPIEHLIMEIGRLILSYSECGKLWILGIATFQTYNRCRSAQPSLETIWGLHAITIPIGSLGLSLLPDSDLQSPLTSRKSDVSETSWLMLDGAHGGGVGSCRRMVDDPRSRQSSACNSPSSSNSTLPSWLQQYKDESNKRACSMSNTNDQDTVPVKDLCKRWNSMVCTTSVRNSQPPTPTSSSFERSLSFSCVSPSSSTSNFSYDPHFMKLRTTHQSFEPKNFFINEQFTMSIQDRDNDIIKPQQKHPNMFIMSASNPNSTPTSTSSSEMNDQVDSQCSPTKILNQYNPDNLKTLCNALEKKVPRQKDIIFDIANTILQCRSGSSTRKLNHLRANNELAQVKEDTWLFFQGADVNAKESIARELARLIFGSSQEKFVSIGLSTFSSTRADSSDDSKNKRVRDEQSCSYTERFAEELSKDCHRVFFIEDIEQFDYFSQMGIKKAIESGKITKNSSGEEISFGDAIVILSCERFSSRSRACSPSTKQKVDGFAQEDEKINKGECGSSEETNSSSNLSLDLNISLNNYYDDDNDGFESQSMDEIGLLASVDRCLVFKNHHQE